MKYDAEKEEKLVQERKQNELTAIEDAIRYAEEAKKKCNLYFLLKKIIHFFLHCEMLTDF